MKKEDMSGYDSFEIGQTKPQAFSSHGPGGISVRADAPALGNALVPSADSDVPEDQPLPRYAFWGENDALPIEQIRYVERSAIMPGLMEFWEGVLLGNGLRLYEFFWDTEKKAFSSRDFYNQTAWDWLAYQSGAVQYLLDSMPDYLVTGNAFGQYLFNQGSEMAGKQKFINEIVHTDAIDCRVSIRKQGWPEYLIVGPFASDLIENVEYERIEYDYIKMFDPRWDAQSKDLPSRAGFHTFRKKAGRKYYGIPVWYSKETTMVLDMTFDMITIKTSSMSNSMSPKYMIMIYKGYFDKKLPAPEYTEQDRIQAKEDLANSVHEKLVGAQNTGKNIWADFIWDERTGEMKAGIVIKPIEGKFEDKLFNDSLDQATAILAMANNTNPGLADLIIKGGIAGDTGSAVREIWNVTSQTKTKINRHHLIKPIMDAFRFNFPELKNVYIDVASFKLDTLDKARMGIVEIKPNQNTEKNADF